MRRQGPITLRHVLVAVLVVVVINAQLTWWIVFVLRLNRDILGIERQRLLGAARAEAARVHSELTTARTALEAAVLMGEEPGRSPAPPPFIGWRSRPLAGECPAAKLNSAGGVELSVSSGLACVTGVAGPEWRQRVGGLGPELELAAAGAGSTPAEAVAAPFDGLCVRPHDAVWQGLIERYRGRILMMVSEGGFFAVLLLVLIALLWRSFRRDVELERQHRNFLSAVTHELKSPLASMRLTLETVTSGRASGESAGRFLAAALEEVERLDALVQKVLEATRYSRGRAVLAPREALLSQLVEEAVAACARRAGAVGAELEVTIEPDIYAEIDEEAMSIAISNLLENAIKYGGRPPRVAVRLGLDAGHAVLEVADNGAGVPEEERKLIFGRFFRGGDEMTRSTKGTGLGLYLVQQIAGAHRGSVKVASTGPEGTVFRLTVPGHER